MSKLTKREMILIYVLLCFMIIMAGLYFVLLPALNQRVDLMSERDEKSQQEVQMQMHIAELPALEVEIQNLQTEIDNKLAGFYPIMLSEQLDQLITEQLLRNKFKPQSLQIGEVAQNSILPFGASTEGDAENAAVSGQIWTCDLNAGISGGQNNFISLLDEISKNPMIYVMGFSIGASEGELTPGLKDFSVSFEVLMDEQGRK